MRKLSFSVPSLQSQPARSWHENLMSAINTLLLGDAVLVSTSCHFAWHRHTATVLKGADAGSSTPGSDRRAKGRTY